jgi:hypothetical protein
MCSESLCFDNIFFSFGVDRQFYCGDSKMEDWMGLRRVLCSKSIDQNQRCIMLLDAVMY